MNRRASFYLRAASRYLRASSRLLACMGAAAALLAPPVFSMAKLPARPPVATPAGLTPVEVKGFHHSFIRREANLATPRPVCIASGESTLDPNWQKKAYGKELRTTDIQRIQRDFDAAARKEFERAFRDQGGYRLAATDSECELRVLVSVQDLYLNAPDPSSSAAQKTYARSIGKMGVKIQVFDASGAILLAQAHGYRIDPEGPFRDDPSDLLSENNRVTEIDNIQFARDTAHLFAEWARTRLLKNY